MERRGIAASRGVRQSKKARNDCHYCTVCHAARIRFLVSKLPSFATGQTRNKRKNRPAARRSVSKVRWFWPIRPRALCNDGARQRLIKCPGATCPSLAHSGALKADGMLFGFQRTVCCMSILRHAQVEGSTCRILAVRCGLSITYYCTDV